VDIAIAIAVVVFAWWISTGAVLYLVGMPRLTFPLTMAASTLALGMALFALWAVGDLTTPAGAYAGFLCGLVVWAWNEMSFLTGLVTGPRTSECPTGAEGWARFSAASQTVIYHELAIVASIVAVWMLTSDMPNQVGLQTLLILWLARLSAKLNVYLGVRNLTEEFLPPHLAYLPSYFRRRPMNFLLPFSITVSTGATAVLALLAFDPSASAFDATGYTMLAALMALVVIEHWFLVLPIEPAAMWSWGLASRGSDAAPVPRTASFVPSAPIGRVVTAPPQTFEIKAS
jgi:putative photosynthetic complex assembly protein 2